jgi:activating signal cointegrator complex subunit 1
MVYRLNQLAPTANIFLLSIAESLGSINDWRSLTLNMLKKGAEQKMQSETTNVTEAAMMTTNNILNSITDSQGTEARDQGLRALVTSAIELSRLLVIQKAVFKVMMPEILPHQKVVFDPSTMEDIGGEDEDGLADREICCVTFPGVIKTGDGSGGQLHFRNIVSKARVLCSPE